MSWEIYTYIQMIAFLNRVLRGNMITLVSVRHALSCHHVLIALQGQFVLPVRKTIILMQDPVRPVEQLVIV